MKTTPTRFWAAACASTVLTMPTLAGAETLVEAVSGGKVSASLRYRYERVDQDNALKNANASTLRTRLGYMSGDYHDFGVFLEFENITNLGDDRFNSTTNGKTRFSVVADPDATEVNQAFLQYQGLPATTLKLGRQRILLDNQRFIGNVGWRQNEQTFDAVTAVNTSLPDTRATAGFISNVNRIFGDDSPMGDFEMDSPFVNLNYAGLPFGAFTAYGYLLDFDDSPANSTKTFGLRFTGATTAGQGPKLLYTAEYARQSDYQDNPKDFDLDYYFVEGGAEIRGITAKLGYEVLEGNGTDAFQTPLATLHAFNGWTDQFLVTPANGLEDLYATVGTSIQGVKLLGVYHAFFANEGDADYGTEWGLLATRKFADHYTLGVKYAAYEAEDFSVDADKLWLWGEVTF